MSPKDRFRLGFRIVIVFLLDPETTDREGDEQCARG